MTHHAPTRPNAPVRLIARAIELCKLIPYSLVAFLARFSIAATFWKSGQTKIEGLAIDLIEGTFEFGLPRLSASAVPLFEEEYRLPLLPAELAAQLAAFSEHLFPLLILLGMTLVIHLFVYPDAYPTHGVWAAVLLLLVAKGPGLLAIDQLIARRYGYAGRSE